MIADGMFRIHSAMRGVSILAVGRTLSSPAVNRKRGSTQASFSHRSCPEFPLPESYNIRPDQLRYKTRSVRSSRLGMHENSLLGHSTLKTNLKYIKIPFPIFSAWWPYLLTDGRAKIMQSQIYYYYYYYFFFLFNLKTLGSIDPEG